VLSRAPKNPEPPKTGSGSAALEGSGSGISGADPQGASAVGILGGSGSSAPMYTKVNRP
jgi:hypothetical protein